MKTRHILLTTLLILTGCSSQSVPGNATNFRAEETFTEYNGLEIRNLQNEKLGNIRFVTVDLEDARIVEVIVDAARPGSGITSVAPRALRLDSKAKVMWLDMSRERFAAAPRINPAEITGSCQRERLAAVNRYYGLKPWFYEQGQTSHSNSQTLRLGEVRRSSQVLNLPVISSQGGRIGSVTALRMDIAKGQIVHVVVKRDGFGGGLNVVQARALRYTANKDALILDATQVQLGGEPRFQWTDSSHTSYREEQYVNRAGSADGKTMRASGMEQGDDFRDRQKTALISERIQSASGLSSSGRAVQVATLNAQTTLRGQVSSEAEKTQIGQIAMQAGRLENVSNLIEVRSSRR
jgi:sporulation protein YlmC with PRC-barrel domain